MTLECRTTKLWPLSGCIPMSLSHEKESQQEKVHDKSTCGMTPRECASRIKEYKTLRTKDYKTKSRNQQHDNRTVIIKRYSHQEMEIQVCLGIGSAYKSSIQRYNILSYSFFSFLFFSSFLWSPLSRHLLIVSSSKRALSSTIITSVTTAAS